MYFGDLGGGKEEKDSRILVESPWPRRWGFRRQAGTAPWQFGFHGGVRAVGERALGALQGREFRFLRSEGGSRITDLEPFFFL